MAGENENITLEVSGFSQKAESALDRLKRKLDEMQAACEKATPSLSTYSNKMNELASNSKAVASFGKVAQSTDRQALSLKDAESRMAMYQARMDRATLSMAKSKAQSDRLSESLRKLSNARSIDAANEKAFQSLTYKGMPNTPGPANKYSEPSETDIDGSIPPGMRSKTATQTYNESLPKSTAVNVDTSRAQTALARIQAFIDSLTPSISGMSMSAQVQFGALSAKLLTVSQQIDNQRALYHQLASASAQVAGKSGENSAAYLRLEKRMLSADGAIDRLIAKQDQMKAQMSDISSAGDRAGLGLLRFGKDADQSSSRATSGFQKTARMMESMFIRIAAFRLFSALSQGVVTGINNMVLANSAANQTMSALSTNALYLKNSLAASLMPVLQSLAPVLNQVTDALANVFNTIGMLTACIFNHASTVTIARKAGVDYAATLDKTKSSADAAKKSLMGFDELNILQKPSGSTSNATPGMPSPASTFETVKIPDWVERIGQITDPFTSTIANWWNSLTDPQKWGAGIGGSAGAIIGGIIGNLICPGIGTVLGVLSGSAAGAAIGTWWEGLTTPEKWSVGIGAGAGAVIGGIIGGIIGGPMGVKIGAVLGGLVGGIAGTWWSDLTTPEKWSAGIGAGAGATIGGIIGGILTGGNPIGIAVGIALGGTIGAIVGKWWSDLTTPQKWSIGIGAGAGAVTGGEGRSAGEVGQSELLPLL